MIIVSLFMFVLIGVAATGIDISTWYTKHHQAQVAADAAALAAANCLANSGSGHTCTSGTDTTDATQVAMTYAQDNGIPITAANVAYSNGVVTVKATTAAPAFFANLFGVHTAVASTTSGAAYTAPAIETHTTTSTSSSGPTPCSQASSATQCSAIYAQSSSCSAGGVTLGTASSGGAHLSITGVVHSEGEMTISNNFSLATTASLTVAGSCYSGSSYPFAYTNSTPSQLTASQVASEPWPVDYSASPYFTACTTNCTTVSGVSGVPPYCTQATTSTSGYSFYQNNGTYVLPVSGNVYCAIGTGTPSNPATWNGPINFSTSVPQYGSGCSSTTNSSFTSATFIGGAVYGSGGEFCMKPALYNCLIYSNGTVTFTNGQLYMAGDIFDPGGTIQLGTSGSGLQVYTVPSGMFEGENFTIQNGQIQQLTGDGPVASTLGGTSTTTSTVTTTTTPGTDSLTN